MKSLLKYYVTMIGIFLLNIKCFIILSIINIEWITSIASFRSFVAYHSISKVSYIRNLKDQTLIHIFESKVCRSFDYEWNKFGTRCYFLQNFISKVNFYHTFWSRKVTRHGIATRRDYMWLPFTICSLSM